MSIDSQIARMYPYSGQQVKIAIGIPGNISEGAAANLGYQQLWSGLNSIEEVYAGLFFLDSETPRQLIGSDIEIASCDAVVFSYSFEPMFLDAIRMLHRAGIPVFSNRIESSLEEAMVTSGLPVSENKRGENSPLVIAGGMGVANPEPFAAYLDAVVLGDVGDFPTQLANILRKTGTSEQRILELGKLGGVYVPSWYQDTKIRDRKSQGYRVIPISSQASEVVFGRKNESLAVFPESLLFVSDPNRIPEGKNIAYLSVVIDGCEHQCFFCSLGGSNPIYLEPKEVRKRVQDLVGRGADLVRLIFPSSKDKSYTLDLLRQLEGLPFRLGSLRADDLTEEAVSRICASGQQKVSLAPETIETLRRGIGKSFSDSVFFEVIGWLAKYNIPNVQLDTLLGVPRETDISLMKYANFLDRVFESLEQVMGNQTRLIVNVNQLFRRPGTYLAHEKQIDFQEAKRKYDLLKGGTRHNSEIVWVSELDRDPAMSLYQPMFAKGGRELTKVVWDLCFRRGIEDYREIVEVLRLNGLEPELYFRKTPWNLHPSAHLRPTSAQTKKYETRS